MGVQHLDHSPHPAISFTAWLHLSHHPRRHLESLPWPLLNSSLQALHSHPLITHQRATAPSRPTPQGPGNQPDMASTHLATAGWNAQLSSCLAEPSIILACWSVPAVSRMAFVLDYVSVGQVDGSPSGLFRCLPAGWRHQGDGTLINYTLQPVIFG